MSTAGSFPQRARAIREQVAGETALRMMGISLSTLEPGGATVSLGSRPELVEDEGRFHDDVTAFLIEQGARIAAATALGEGRTCLSTVCRVNLFGAARGDRLVCRARVVRAGRLASVVAADVVCLSDGREVPTATAIATISIVDASAIAPAGHA